MKIPHSFHPGNWHKGDSLDIRIFSDKRDTYPNNFLCYVEIRDGEKVHVRRGRGRFIGNFAPIWIRWKGKTTQVETLAKD